MVPREPTARADRASYRRARTYLSIENYEAWPGQTADLWMPNSIGTRGLRSNLRPDSESARKIGLERLSVNTPWENKNKNCSDTGDPYLGTVAALMIGGGQV